MRLLITGVAGFIGSHIADLALDAGWDVTGIDNFSMGTETNIAGARGRGLTIRIGSVEDEVDLPSVRARCDLIIHCAARLGVALIAENPLPMLREHPFDALAVCEAAKKWGATLVMVSSSEVYGNSAEPLNEESPLQVFGSRSRRSGYAVTKLLCEHLALRYAEEYGVKVVVPRLFNVAGPRQSPMHGVIARFVDDAMSGRPLELHYGGHGLRSFTPVRDVAKALLGLAQCEAARGQIVNVGSEYPIEIRRVVDEVRKQCSALGVPVGSNESYPKDETHTLLSSMGTRIPDATKMATLLGYRFPNALEGIVRDTIEHWQKIHGKETPHAENDHPGSDSSPS